LAPKQEHSLRPSPAALIDTHCHLEMKAFKDDREEVLRRAKDAGIDAVITIGSDVQSNMKGLEISLRYDSVYMSVGIHPHDAKDFTGEIREKIKEWIKKFGIHNAESGIHKVVAIGEIGLDYHYDHSPRDVQQKVFRQQLEDAGELNLPVVIHSREAEKDTLPVLFNCLTFTLNLLMSFSFRLNIA
jgi:TatD DNase family protein